MSSEIPDPPEIEVVIEVTIAAVNVPKTSTIIYLSRLSVCPSKGFSKALATDDFDLIILRLVYIFIMNGELLVPSPVT